MALPCAFVFAFSDEVTEQETSMSLIDRAVEGNRNYAKAPDPKLRERPRPSVAVVTCMDPRLSDLPAILGLSHHELDVIRTAGPAVTQEVLWGVGGVEPSHRNDGDHASQPYGLRLYDFHQRRVECEAR